jgi:hypothetical protein
LDGPAIRVSNLYVNTQPNKNLGSSVPVSPLKQDDYLAVNSSLGSAIEPINVSDQRHKHPQSSFALKNSRIGKIDLENSSHSSAVSASEDSFIEQVEKERKIREEREQYLDDSDEEDFLLPKSIKLKILKEKERADRLKASLKRQEEEDNIKKLRIEVVRRDSQPQVESVQSTAIGWNKPDTSNLGSLMRGYGEDDTDEEENDDYVDPYEALAIRRQSQLRQGDISNLVDYSYNSQANNLMKVVKLNVTGMEDKGSKTKKLNSYYKPPRKVEFNWQRNFGVSFSLRQSYPNISVLTFGI